MKQVYWLLLGISVVCGCASKGGGFQCATPESKESVRLDSLSVERLQLDSVATSSFGESLLLPNHHIAFVDKRLCLVSLFDTLGHFQKKYLGIGGAPDETQIGRIAASTFLQFLF